MHIGPRHSVPSDQQATVESLRQQLRAYRDVNGHLKVRGFGQLKVRTL